MEAKPDAPKSGFAFFDRLCSEESFGLLPIYGQEDIFVQVPQYYLA
jgi:hypothetical protein